MGRGILLWKFPDTFHHKLIFKCVSGQFYLLKSGRIALGSPAYV